MSFIRPEAAAQITRWRETLAGGGAALLGLYLLASGAGSRPIIGTALIIGGALLAIAGIQRARFRGQHQGAGVVQVTEGQLAYLGPTEGGIAATREITRLDLTPTDAWVIHHRTGAPLTIPTGARGAEALFDVFATLPGLDTHAMLADLRRPRTETVTIWQADPTRLPRQIH